MITGIVLGVTFISIAAYLLLFPDAASADAKEDLRLYAMLMAAYGVWRLVRVSMARNEEQSL